MRKKFSSDFTVIENIQLNSTNFLVKFKSSQSLPVVKPGQFVNIDINNSREIYLNRPFSIFDVDYNENTISIIVKILGRGSKKLTEIEKGHVLGIIYPLGIHFTFPSKTEKILLVGGGSGLAPLLFLIKEAGLPVENCDVIIGARSKEDHIDMSGYSGYGNIMLTTEDGSLGTTGMVTDHPILKEGISGYDRIYSCGPAGMMKAVAKLAKNAGIFCEVSLENLMACGFGVCLCCIEPTVNGNLCVCTDGPVFNINELKWQI